MKSFFYPLLSELNEIHCEGGICMQHNGRLYRFLPIISQCNVDLPAKADVQGFIGHNGYFGCGYCKHPGESIKASIGAKAVVRFIKKENISLRTHKDILNLYSNLKTSPIFGVKNISCMIAARHFDLINCFSIDYMHCVLLGVVRKLLDLWLNSKYHNEAYYLSKNMQCILNKRILSIKPPTEITRKPRSISDRADFKANEFRSLLLYYLRYSLVDLIPVRFINNFQLLSSSIYLLLEEEVSLENISLAETKLIDFADGFEKLYGQTQITMNVHLLRHIANSVRYIGPLWSQSTFGFETNNGILVHSRQAKNKYLHQLSWKYSMKLGLDSPHKNESGTLCTGSISIPIGSDEFETFEKCGIHLTSNHCNAYAQIKIHGKKFTSKKSKVVSTVDYFIQCRNKEIGAVKYYFVHNSRIYAFIELYRVVASTDHLMEIKGTEVDTIINVTDLSCKLIYMKIGKTEVVTKIPNTFEKT